MSKNHHGDQNGPQQHAEGQHGPKTAASIAKGNRGQQDVSSEPPAEPRLQIGPLGVQPDNGRHRLNEDREQHDEADKNSDKLRLIREMERKHVPVTGGRVNGRR